MKTIQCLGSQIALCLSFTLSTVSALEPFQTPGVSKNLPIFYERLSGRMDFPLSWLRGGHGGFDSWRREACAQVMKCLLPPPSAGAFNAVTIAEQDRGTYVARKMIFNVSVDSRLRPTRNGEVGQALGRRDTSLPFPLQLFALLVGYG